ncbi:MAG: acetylxylan esterase [Lentisphaerae bacterium]|nr:acetylxylan esterase [Lentisphaerota bacterium]
MKHQRRLLSLIVALLVTLSLHAQVYTIKATTDKPEAIYKKGETIQFAVQFLVDDQPQAGTTLKYSLRRDGHDAINSEVISAAEPVHITTSLDTPGWAYVMFTPVDKEGKRIELKAKSSAGVGAMVDPLELRYAGKCPDDFDAFWAQQRATLDAIPLNPRLEPSPVNKDREGKFVAFDVKVDCAGGMPVSGYLVMPAGAQAKSLPAVVSYHGAGVRSANKSYRDNAINFDVNAHGIDNGQPAEFYDNLRENELKGYPHRDKNDRDQFYFKGMYLRVMRALDFVKTLPEWNGRDLIVIGGSQGGGQAIVAAGLDPQVTLCVSGVPALGDHAGTLAKPRRNAGWPRLYAAEKDGTLSPENAQVAKTAEYFDNVNFARRIRCETFLSTGFIDTTCVPTSVYVVFNTLPADIRKEISTTPDGGHGAPNPKGYARLAEVLAKR